MHALRLAMSVFWLTIALRVTHLPIMCGIEPESLVCSTEYTMARSERDKLQAAGDPPLMRQPDNPLHASPGPMRYKTLPDRILYVAYGVRSESALGSIE
jgi:hypothetical protein